MKGMEQTTLFATPTFILLSIVPVSAGVLSPGRYTQHKYERFDTYSMTYEAARAACEFHGGQLDIPALTPADMHYRLPLGRRLRKTRCWAPVQRKTGDMWRWANGSLVDVDDDDKERLRTYNVTTAVTCAAWNFNSGYVPVSCEESYSFMCLMEKTAECRMIRDGNRDDSHGILWNETDYLSFDSMSNVTTHFEGSQSPALFRQTRISRPGCKEKCDAIHFNDTLSMGCWMAQHERTQSRACTLLLAPSAPTQLHPVVVLQTTRLMFRSCIQQYAYNHTNCEIECSCMKPGAPMTMEEAVAEGERIKSELTLPTTNLSSTVRRKTSAKDARPSATAVGMVGVSVISSLLILIVILDLTSIRRDLRMMMMNIGVFRVPAENDG